MLPSPNNRQPGATNCFPGCPRRWRFWLLHRRFAAKTRPLTSCAPRAFFRDRPIRGCKFALRIIRAPVERIALARPLLDQLAIFALRTLYTDKILLHVLALRISAARGELAEAPVPDHQIPATFRAKL